MSNPETTHTEVVTRFAPSPTGALHIGGARTALFNWLYARGRNGKFLVRIEDTDKARSTEQNRQVILDGLSWLGIDWDGDPISQSARAPRHIEVAQELLAKGAAYRCFSTPQEIEEFRETARSEGESTLFQSPWRDVAPENHPDAPFTVRLKAPREGSITIEDKVQGRVSWQAHQLDDLILLRSDGSPVYMLAVVVDDHDMGVTHVIRGDDHLANAFRQQLIYNAMGWRAPVMAHIPLIYGPDGKKLSKRHGATAAGEYQAMGYPAAGMRNYLTRLGWSHGDDEVFTDAQAREWFNLEGIGKSPARFDTKKLEHICGHHMAMASDAEVRTELEGFLMAIGKPQLRPEQIERLDKIMGVLKTSAKTFPQLLDKAHFALTDRPIEAEPKAAKHLDETTRGYLGQLTPKLQNARWTRESLEEIVTATAEAQGVKMGKLAGPLRAALAGRAATPSVFDMMLGLGREETIGRVRDAALA